MVAVEHGWWWAGGWWVGGSSGGSAHCGEGEEDGDCGEEEGEEERARMGMGWLGMFRTMRRRGGF